MSAVWPAVLQYCAAGIDVAVITLIAAWRAEDYFLGSMGADLRLDDSNLRDASLRWTYRCGERKSSLGNWWELKGDSAVLKGAIAKTGRAVDVYLRLEVRSLDA